MKPSLLLLTVLLSATLVGSGCKERPKEISPLARKQAANFASEAVFAAQVRDVTRAEGLFAQAAELDPENAGYWISLGASRKKLGNLAGARKAYEGALSAHERAYAADAKSPAPLLDQARVLALLGKVEDARKVLASASKKHPDDRDLKAFIEAKEFDHMLADSAFKDIAL